MFELCIQVLYNIIFAQAVVMPCKNCENLMWFLYKKYLREITSLVEFRPRPRVRSPGHWWPGGSKGHGEGNRGIRRQWAGFRVLRFDKCNCYLQLIQKNKFLTVWVRALADKVGLLGVAAAVDPPHAGAALAPHAPLNNIPQTWTNFWNCLKIHLY